MDVRPRRLADEARVVRTLCREPPAEGRSSDNRTNDLARRTRRQNVAYFESPSSYCFKSSLISTATSCDTQLVSFQPSPTLKSKRLIFIVPANCAPAPPEGAVPNVKVISAGFVVPLS